MTLAQMRAMVRQRLNQTSAVPADDDTIDAALNNGYAEISDASEWHETWEAVDILNRRPYYDARTVLSETMLSVGPAFNLTTNRWLAPSDVTDLDRRDRRWEWVTAATGAPILNFTRSPWFFAYWPRANGDGSSGKIKQYFTSLPEPLTEDSDVPGFSSPFHEGLVEYAIYELWAQQGETKIALDAWARYLGYETGLIQDVQQRALDARFQGYGTQP